MNSYQRTMAAIYGETIDRVPVIPLVIQHALHIAGVSHSSYSTNPNKMAKAQINAMKTYGYDGIHITTDNQIISEALGCKLKFPFDEPPQYHTRVLSDNKCLKQLKAIDPYTSGRMPVIIEATNQVLETIGETHFVKTNCDSGPFSIAAALRGEEKFFMDIYDDEQYVFDLLDICTDAVICYAKAIAKTGTHAITFGDSTAGLIGRELYRKYALPFEKKMIQALKDSGIPIFMHICGDTTDILDLMAQAGADALEVDSEVDLKSAYNITNESICLVGNISTVDVLLQGSEQDVYNEAIACIQKSVGQKFILSSGCEVPRTTPSENMLAMVRASIEF